MAAADASPKHVSRTRIILLALMVFLISLLYYATVPGHIYYHTLFRVLYFLPLVFAGIWFGLRGAVIAPLAISESLTAMGKALSAVAHDMKSPLTAKRVLKEASWKRIRS